MSNINDINDYNNNNEMIIKNIYYYSHLVSSTLCVLYLKKYNPILLFFVLFAQLVYLSATESNIMGINRALLFICGFIFYFASEYITNKVVVFDYHTLWKIPYYGIITYYLLNLNNTLFA